MTPHSHYHSSTQLPLTPRPPPPPTGPRVAHSRGRFRAVPLHPRLLTPTVWQEGRECIIPSHCWVHPDCWLLWVCQAVGCPAPEGGLWWVSCPILSCSVLHQKEVYGEIPVLFCPVLSCTRRRSMVSVLFCPILSCPILYCTIVYCPVLSYSVLSCSVLPWPVLFYSVLLCTVLSCPALSYSVLFYPVLTCPILFCPIMHMVFSSAHHLLLEKTWLYWETFWWTFCIHLPNKELEVLASVCFFTQTVIQSRGLRLRISAVIVLIPLTARTSKTLIA